MDPGVIEVCKEAEPGSGLTGSFSFTITGNNGFTTTVTAHGRLVQPCDHVARRQRDGDGSPAAFRDRHHGHVAAA